MLELTRRAFAAGLVLASLAVPSYAADQVKVSLAASDDPAYLPYFIALERGIYQKHNIEPEFVFAAGGVATPALIAGDLHFSTSGGAAVSAILKGAGLKIVMNSSEKPPFKLWSTTAEIKTLADLKGQAVGIQSRGDLFEVTVRAALIKAGLKGDDVVYSPLGFGGAQRVGVITSGSLPAVVLTNVEEEMARRSGDLAKAHLLVDIMNDITVPFTGAATSDKLIAENPDLVQRFVTATIEGLRYMKDHQDEALEILATKAPKVDREILRKSIADAAAGLLVDGMAPAESLKSEVALRGGMLGIAPEKLPSPDKVFDYSFAGKVAK